MGQNPNFYRKFVLEASLNVIHQKKRDADHGGYIVDHEDYMLRGGKVLETLACLKKKHRLHVICCSQKVFRRHKKLWSDVIRLCHQNLTKSLRGRYSDGKSGYLCEEDGERKPG